MGVREDGVRGEGWGYLQERGLWNRFLLVNCCSWVDHHKRDYPITRSKISYSLIKPLPLPCIPAYCHEFHVFWILVRGLWWGFSTEAIHVLTPPALFAEELRRWCLTVFLMRLCLSRGFLPLVLSPFKLLLKHHCSLLWSYLIKVWKVMETHLTVTSMIAMMMIKNSQRLFNFWWT